MAQGTEILELSGRLGQLLLENDLTITTAESCTGGLIAGAITEISGSSAWFEQGFVTYSNAAKHGMLGVQEAIFDEHGAVSEACVLAMAKGAKQTTGANIAISVSGVAGPSGGSTDKPVGTVWVAWAVKEVTEAQVFHFEGCRQRVRAQAVECALRGSIERIERQQQS